MKRKEKEALRSKEVSEIKKTLSERRGELTKVAAEMYGGKEKNLKKARNLRREIAQILTILKEREYIVQSAEERKKNNSMH